MNGFLDVLQWPAMIATLVAAWLVGSQTKARLMEIQKKRSELMRKRQGVRNYNDTSD